MGKAYRRLPSTFGEIASELYMANAQARLLDRRVFEASYATQFDDGPRDPREFRIDDSITYRLTAFGV